MVHRESEEIRRASNHFTFANKAFISDSDLLKNIVIQREEFALKEATQRNASLHTPLKTRLAEDQCFFQRLKQFAWILPLIHTHFWASAAFILIQTFYAPLAASAGLEAWKYGFVFATFKISMLFGSLLSERLIAAISPLKTYLCGQLGYFTFLIAFGSLYWCSGGSTLLALSLVMVIFGGILRNMYLVTTFSVILPRFPMRTGVIIALVDFTCGCGNLFGSIIGGALIDVWAFPLPFYVISCIMILSFPVLLKNRAIFSKDSKPTKELPREQGSASDMKLYRLLWRPPFLIDMVTLMLSWAIFGFNEPTLEPHLVQFDLTGTQVGLVFMVQSASYALGALTSGLFCHFKMETFLAFIGQSATALAFLIIGPAPFIPGSTKLWMVYLAQVFVGLGTAAQFTCSFCHASKYAVARGYPCDVRTSSFISASMLAFLVFGGTVMPPIAGYLVETFGYRTGSMFLFGMLLLWTPVTFFHWLCSPKASKDVESKSEAYVSRL